MKRIRQRQRADTLPVTPRKAGGALGRRIYYTLLLLCVLGFGNYLFGDRLFLRSEGVIKHAMVTLEAPATVLVTAVFVRPGQTVRKGDALLQLDSIDSRVQMSMLAERLASLKDIQYQRRQDRARATDQLPLVRAQIAALEHQLQTLQDLQSRGLSTQREVDTLSVQILELRRELADLTARAGTIFASDDETTLLQHNLAGLGALVGDGIVRAPCDGRMGQDLISLGEVATTGERLASVLHGEHYVIAYLPEQYFFSVAPGLRVRIIGQQNSTNGVIEEILPYSEALPIEFHNSLRPRGRNLLARIMMDDPSGFVMDQGVRIGLTDTWYERVNSLSQKYLAGDSDDIERFAQRR
ncbi:MAG: HlyD family efflux transporter periplasmic adaptor subunit [Rhodobacteraceae bacterium]|jgi:multidrug resistance efflux pump|nr:HlyD family efflux transporter periplasmic adaptor subunit [Paracoccaceae bacterium]